MRVLPPRRLASATLCAALLVGVAGSAAVATDLAGERTQAGSRSAVPGAEPLLARIEALSGTGAVPAPVRELLEQSLHKGRLTPAEARRLGEAAKRSVTEAATGTPATAATPAAPTSAPAPSMDPTLSTAASPSMAAASGAATPSAATGPAAPATPALPADGTMSQTLGMHVPAPDPLAADGAARVAAPTARDAASDVLATLTGAIDALVKAVVAGLDDVLPAATGVVNGLLGLLKPLLPGTGTPTLALPSVPALPSLPAVPALPTG
ncbi:hypothetical protein ACWDXT_03395 [Streptomyces sp. NPDC003236]